MTTFRTPGYAPPAAEAPRGSTNGSEYAVRGNGHGNGNGAAAITVAVTVETVPQVTGS